MKLASHRRKVEKLGRPALEIEGLVIGIGLSSLITCSLETRDFCMLLWRDGTRKLAISICP